VQTYQKYISKAAVLIEALPYIQQFRGALVVVKFGGSAMEDATCAESALRDIVLMECVGMKPVVVHGGGKAISARLKELNIETRFVNGLRYTCEESIKVVDDVLHNQINRQLVQSIEKFGGQAVGLSGKDVIGAIPMNATDEAGEPADLGFVGEVDTVNVDPILAVTDRNEVPVITPLGTGADGAIFNINADLSACRIAEALAARKLVFLSDVPGILADSQDESSLIKTVCLPDVDRLIEDRTITGGMVPKIRSAVDALQAGTNKVHLVDGRIQHSLLLEIFTDEGVGTQIVKT
jgi:acetylglutamate kinase